MTDNYSIYAGLPGHLAMQHYPKLAENFLFCLSGPKKNIFSTPAKFAHLHIIQEQHGIKI